MARTAIITLDGCEYTIRAFNLKELQEVGEILSSGDTNFTTGGAILAIALRRATPSVMDIAEVEPTIPEVSKATEAILKLAGIESQPTDPQAAAPATS